MKRENILTWLVVFLTVLNGAVLLYFISREHAPEPAPPDRIIIETLQLDSDQRAEFKKLKDEHHNKMVELNARFRLTMENYFLTLQTNSIGKDSLEQVITQLEKERLSITYSHFQDVKKMCKNDQLEKFNAFLPELIRLVGAPRSKKDGPPRRN